MTFLRGRKHSRWDFKSADKHHLPPFSTLATHKSLQEAILQELTGGHFFWSTQTASCTGEQQMPASLCSLLCAQGVVNMEQQEALKLLLPTQQMCIYACHIWANILQIAASSLFTYPSRVCTNIRQTESLNNSYKNNFYYLTCRPWLHGGGDCRLETGSGGNLLRLLAISMCI